MLKEGNGQRRARGVDWKGLKYRTYIWGKGNMLKNEEFIKGKYGRKIQ